MTSRLEQIIRRRFDPAERFGLRITLFAIAMLAAGIPFALLLAQVVRNGPLVRADTSAARHLHEWVREHPLLVDVLNLITLLGTTFWFCMICGVAIYVLWRRGHYRLIVYLAVTTLMSGLINSVVKGVVDRDRPSLGAPIASAHGQSFPSGHAMNSLVVYGTLLLIFIPILQRRRAWIASTAMLVLAIGFTRLALGVHYVSDVLGGYVLGAAWLTASTAAFSIWRVDRGGEPVEPMRGLEPEAKLDLAGASDLEGNVRKA